MFAPLVKEITPGYNLSLYFYPAKKIYASTAAQSVSMEKVYKDFWYCHHQKPGVSQFIQFLQFLQVKSYAEEIYASLGSITNMAIRKGQVLYPQNYVREIYLLLHDFSLFIIGKKKKNKKIEKQYSSHKRKRFLIIEFESFHLVFCCCCCCCCWLSKLVFWIMRSLICLLAYKKTYKVQNIIIRKAILAKRYLQSGFLSW